MILLASLILWTLVEVALQVREKGNVFSRNEHQQQTLMVCVFSAVFCAGLLSSWRLAHMPGDGHTYRLVGGLLVLGGVLLRVWSVRTLGRFFRLAVVIQEGHKVVQSGPYRWVRHPSYSGFLLGCLGYAVSLQNWASLAAVVALDGLGFYLRMQAEEKVLCDGLGDEYRRYMQRTWRLLPGVY